MTCAIIQGPNAKRALAIAYTTSTPNFIVLGIDHQRGTLVFHQIEREPILTMLKRLVQGVRGAEGIKEFFQQNKVKTAHKALGEALFFVEGGRIQGELIYAPLCALEQRLFAHQFGLPSNKWDDLRFLVETALLEGVIDRVREEVLRQHYAQEKLQLIAQEGA